MVPTHSEQSQVTLEVENIGGIDQTEISFNSGVTTLTGKNTTNRTSLLQAIMAALGSKRVSLKRDADIGQVRLTIGEEEFTRKLIRQDGDVIFRGDPYLDDPELADLYAFLVESNEARRTVQLEGNLREVIMQPIDADAIQTEIRQLCSARDYIDDQIEERESLKSELPELERKRTNLEERIQSTQADLEKKQKQLSKQSKDSEEAETDTSLIDQKTDQLHSLKSDLESVEFRLENQRDSLESLESQEIELKNQYEEVSRNESTYPDQIESKLDQFREQKRELDAEIDRLQNIIQFNEEMLEGASEDIAAALRGEESDESVTNGLIQDEDQLVCWSCGSNIERPTIEKTLDRLRDLRSEKYDDRNGVEDRIDDLEGNLSSLKSQRQREQELQRRLRDVHSEMEERETKAEQLKDEREELREHVEELQTEIEGLKEEDRSEELELQTEINELEYELADLKEQREQIVAQIEDREERIEEFADLEERREQISEQITQLRTQIERIEQQAVESFNEHMATIVSLLNYDNLDRIWIERIETDVRKGRGTTTESTFRSHIVRSTEDETTYEDKFEHLSESEREVMGLVFALAGYLAHDVHEVVPFILLDSLEAIDSDRIATLIDHFEQYPTYLVTALLPEDAVAISAEYEKIEIT